MNRIRWAGLMGVVLVLMASCEADQAREVQTYRQVMDVGQNAPPAPFSTNEPMALQRALVLANANNELLAFAGEDYLQALIDKDRAFARFLPTIRFAPIYMRQEKTSIGGDNPLVSSIVRPETLDAPLQGNLTLNPLQDAAAIWAAAYSAGQGEPCCWIANPFSCWMSPRPTTKSCAPRSTFCF